MDTLPASAGAGARPPADPPPQPDPYEARQHAQWLDDGGPDPTDPDAD